MRALLVVHDALTLSAIESVLTRRRWDFVLAPAAEEALLIQRGQPASLVIAEESARGSASWLFGSIRRHRGGDASHLIGWLPTTDDAAVTRLADAGTSEVAIGP